VRGWRVPLVLEIDPRQSPEVPALFPEHHVDITTDYAGRDRVVTVLPVSQ
jgi:methylase of polypeptide subunit release factors